MQNNHVYVEDDGKGKVSVYDDEGRLHERTFHYTSAGSSRADARRKGETFAAQHANRLHCGWGCNYEGHAR